MTWQLGHERLLGIRKKRARLDAEEALWLVVCEGLGTHRELGLGSFVEYVSAVLGLDVVALTPSEVDRLACDARVVPGARIAAVVETEPHAGSERRSRGGPGSGSHGGSHDSIARAATPSPARMAELERRRGLRVETELSKKVRELVLRRHHGRCAAPGCSNAMCLHVHHVEPRADGGSGDAARVAGTRERGALSAELGRLTGGAPAAGWGSQAERAGAVDAGA